MMLKFSIDASPASWANGQKTNNRDRVGEVVDRSIEVARLADQAGIDSLFALEDPDGWDAFAVLGAMARATERIRLGTGVTNPYFRHPSLMAASLSTLDLLSNGRAFLGLGRGQSEWYASGMGMPYGKPVAKLIETIDLLRQWFAPPYSATSPDDATEFGLKAWRRQLHPLQSTLPVYLAAVGPRAQRVAARHADGMIFNDLTSRTFMRESIASVRSTLADVGRDPDAFHFYARAAVTVTSDPEQHFERRKNTVAMIHTLPGMDALLRSDGFDIEKIMADVRKVMRTDEILARGGGFPDLQDAGDLEAARNLIPVDLIAELTVAGPVDHVRARLAELEEIGLTHVFLGGLGPTESLESLEATLASLR